MKTVTNRVEKVLNTLGPVEFTTHTLTETINDKKNNGGVKLTKQQVGNSLQYLSRINKVYRTYDREDGDMIWVNYLPEGKEIKLPEVKKSKKVKQMDLLEQVKELQRVQRNTAKVRIHIKKVIEGLKKDIDELTKAHSLL